MRTRSEMMMSNFDEAANAYFDWQNGRTSMMVQANEEKLHAKMPTEEEVLALRQQRRQEREEAELEDYGKPAFYQENRAKVAIGDYEDALRVKCKLCGAGVDNFCHGDLNRNVSDLHSVRFGDTVSPQLTYQLRNSVDCEISYGCGDPATLGCGDDWFHHYVLSEYFAEPINWILYLRKNEGGDNAVDVELNDGILSGFLTDPDKQSLIDQLAEFDRERKEALERWK